MKKTLAVMFLSGAFAAAMLGGDVSAQDKKKGKDLPKTAVGGVIELVESKDGKFRFTVRDADGKYVGGSSVGHATEAETKAAVEDLRKALNGAKYVSKKSEPAEKKTETKEKN